MTDLVPPAIETLHTRDFELLREMEAGWDQQYDLIKAGGFEGSISLLELDGRQLSDVYWGSQVRYRGITPPGAVAMGLPVCQSDSGKWLGLETGEDDLIVQSPGQPAEFLGPDNWRTLVLSIPETRFTQLCSNLLGRHDINAENLQGIHRLFPEHARELRHTALQTLSLASACQTAGKQQWHRALAQMMDDVELRFVWSIANAKGIFTQLDNTTAARKIVRQAEDYTEAVTHRSVSVSELCSVLDVGERSLHRAFIKSRGVSSSAWIRTMRLNRAYKSLRQHDPKRGLVKAIALENGFHHFGRFATQYTAFFGESPSATLGRR